MQKNNDRPILLLTVVQVLVCAAMVILGCLWMAVLMALIVIQAFGTAPLWLVWVQSLCITGTVGCLVWVLGEAFGLCGRIKTATAFTQRNAKALGHIVAAFTAAAVLMIPAGSEVMMWVLPDGDRWAFLPAFACIMAALLLRAVQLLLRHAADVQDEHDLTI